MSEENQDRLRVSPAPRDSAAGEFRHARMSETALPKASATAMLRRSEATASAVSSPATEQSMMVQPSFRDSSHDVIRASLLKNLQRSYGNRWVQRMLYSDHGGATLRADSTSRNSVPPRVAGHIQRSRGQGQALDADVRAPMESGFDRDLGHVRVHTDSGAGRSADALGARAFTSGRAIYFGQGQYQPHSRQGQRLLAHEITHTVQQDNVSASPRAKLRLGASRDPQEREADAMAERVVSGQAAGAAPFAPGGDDSIRRVEESAPAAPEAFAPEASGREPDLESSPEPAGTMETAPLPAAEAVSEPTVARDEDSGGFLGSVTGAIGSAVGSAVGFVGNSIEAARDYIKDRARGFLSRLPGYRLLSVVLAQDPLTGAAVARNGRNFIEAGLDVIPNGRALKDKLEREGALSEAAQWLDAQILLLNFDPAAIASELRTFWQQRSLEDIGRIGQVLNQMAGIFRRPIARLWRFAENVARQLLRIIKNYVTSSLITFIRDQTSAYPLLTVILGRDPISNEPVERTPIALLRGFMQLSESGREQLRQMEESGSLQRAANWLDGAVARLNLSWETIQNLFRRAWEAVTIQRLMDPPGLFRELYNIFAGPVGRIIDFVVEVSAKVLKFIKDALIRLLVNYARTIRGYPLLTVLLGKDPFSEEAVPRTVENIIHGFLSLFENGEEQFRQMQESGAISRMSARVEAAIAMLNFTWGYVRGLFTTAWERFSLQDLARPFVAFARLMDIFAAPLLRLIEFTVEIVKIAIEVIMQVMQFPIDLIQNIINRAMQAFDDIQRDPIGFLKNLIRAVKVGFQQFFGNIVRYLISGLTGWLFGELEEAGINPPADFSFRSILGFVLDVLGITVERIWEKLAERIGQERVNRIRGMIDRLTGIWTFVSDVMTRGPVAIWEHIQQRLSNLWNTVLDAVKNWVMTRVIQRVTARLITMLDPTGIMTVINGFITFYNAVQSFIRYLREMLEVVNTFVMGVAELARGNVSTAANFLENALANAMPIAIGFLANQVGLSGIGRRIGEMIEQVREMVDRALTWLIDRAVSLGERMLASLRSALGMGGDDQAAGAAPGEWWRKERPTTVANATHRVFFQGNGAQSRLMISSGSTQTPQQWLAESREGLSTDEQRQAHAEVSSTAQQISQQVGGNQSNIDDRALDANLDRLISAVQRTKMGSDPESRLQAAQADMQLFLNSNEDTEQMQGHFAEIQQRYNLASIEYENVGSPDASIKMEINPIVNTGVTGNHALKATGTGATIVGSGGETISSLVTWSGGSLSLNGPSHPVGSVMTALPLAKDLDTGDSNTSSINSIMGPLPTGSGWGVNERFIAGHLLNNNVGGPNRAENLFPITEQANRDHLNWVERFVKQDIDNGFVGKYEVRVTGVNKQLWDDGIESVDANFVCSYQRISMKKQPMGTKHEIPVRSRYDGSGRNEPPQRMTDRPLSNLPLTTGGGTPAMRV